MPLKMPKAPANFKVSPAQFEVVPLKCRFEDRNIQVFVDIMSFFVYQAKQEGRYREFLATVCGRLSAMWPAEYAKDLPAHVAMTKTKIHSQFKGSFYHQKQAVPQIHWENFLALSIQDIADIGGIIMAQAEVLRSAAFKRAPILRNDTKRKDAQELVKELRGQCRRVQHAATEVAVNPSDPEGKMKTIDASDPDDIPDKDGLFVEMVYDMTLDDDDLDDDDDYVPDEEDDMFLSD